MTEKEMFLDACKGLVMNCDCTILVLNVLGEYRAYLGREVRLKTRETRYNEAQNMQDITKLVRNIGMNFAQGMTERRLLEQVQSIPKESFMFGSEDYMWITRVELNR